MVGGLLLLLGICAAIKVAYPAFLNSGPQPKATGEVVRIGSRPSKFGDQPMFLVRVADGSIHQVLIPTGQKHWCKVGDPIALISTGKTYRVDVLTDRSNNSPILDVCRRLQ